jgi:threonine dehydrogenase-like Zn-dependent dehydrogenase
VTFEATIAGVAAALPAGGGPLEVSGENALAQALRERLGGDPPGATRPRVVVETTGGGDAIRAALARVADLGTVVLAGAIDRAPIELDLYADLHVRGLTIVGVAPRAGPAAAT